MTTKTQLVWVYKNLEPNSAQLEVAEPPFWRVFIKPEEWPRQREIFKQKGYIIYKVAPWFDKVSTTYVVGKKANETDKAIQITDAYELEAVDFLSTKFVYIENAGKFGESQWERFYGQGKQWTLWLPKKAVQEVDDIAW